MYPKTARVHCMHCVCRDCSSTRTVSEDCKTARTVSPMTARKRIGVIKRTTTGSPWRETGVCLPWTIFLYTKDQFFFL